MSVIKASKLDLSTISFSDIKTDIHGRKMVYVNGNGGKILVQTPKMYAPNGIKRWRKPDATNNKDDKFEMELSFYGENGTDANSKEIREFHEKWKGLDEVIKDKVIEKSKEWLSMPKLDKTTLESVMYTPMVRVAKDKDGNQLPYPSRVRAKLDRELDSAGEYTGRFLSNKKQKSEILLFDENKERLPLNEANAESAVPKGSQVVCILELVYLSLSKTTISTKWKLVQAKVFKNKNTITEYAMLDDDLDELSENDTKLQTIAENAEEEEEDGVEEHEENEEEQAHEEDEEEEPVKATTKPRGRAKRTV